MIYFHSFRSPGFLLDIVRDIRDLNEHSRTSRKAGMIVLGGGVCKHQVANAMLIVYLSFPVFDGSLTSFSKRNGADFSVYIVRHLFIRSSPLSIKPYTGQEYWSRV
jgi:deoxyhypusine synthase